MLDEAVESIADKKRAAYGIMADAMAEAAAEGIEHEIVTQAALFAVFAELVSAYGETAVADLAKRLPDRIMGGEYTVLRQVQ